MLGRGDGTVLDDKLTVMRGSLLLRTVWTPDQVRGEIQGGFAASAPLCALWQKKIKILLAGHI